MHEDLMYVERVKRGDTASFRFLVDKYQDMAFTIAYRILKNAGDAEDAAQEGFVKAYQQIHRFEGRSKFSTWLYTVIYRSAIDKTHGKRFLKIDEAGYEKQGHTDTPVQKLMEEEQSEAIKKAVDALPPTESLLITLFYMDDCSIREIADISGLSEMNIKVKLFRARKTLQERLRFLL
ncbi:RNA polymerase sigma factor [Leadbetterella sp. DM7]|uniref:RNA polymerase sigma factor n=1 Tax=Leadbetterella sp. DM7 TaxID=3235085 RepID=UPI00349ED10F